ncbi:MAG: LacI family DNA-binding transcriptional regulator [Bacteroidales bacterium]|nr:LacI family DNA-binding transcriptional regulator [Bacteroidales bacterium]
MAIKRKKTSLKDIAVAAGVSTTAVSYVLNGKHKKNRIGDGLAEKIRTIARELDYVPNGFARSLQSGAGLTMGVIVSDISNSFSSTLVKSIETTAESFGYMAIFSSSDENASKLDRLVQELLGKEVDGLIIVPCEGSEQTILGLERRGVPLVLLDRFVPGSGSDYIGLDNEAASAVLASRLIENGHRKVGCICYDFKVTNMKERIDGYKNLMASMDSPFVEVRFADYDNLPKGCSDAVDSLYEAGCDAIICSTYPIALNSFRRIQGRNLRVPEDIALASYDGGPIFEFFSSPIIYYSQPLEEMARLAVESLVGRIRGDTEGRRIMKISGTLHEPNLIQGV